MHSLPVVFTWEVGTTWTRKGPRVRSVDSYPEGRPLALRVMDRLRHFGFARFFFDVSITPAPWLDDDELRREQTRVVQCLEREGVPFAERTIERVPLRGGYFDLRSYGTYLIEALSDFSGEAFLFLDCKAALVPADDLRALVNHVAGDTSALAHYYVGKPWESVLVRRREVLRRIAEGEVVTGKCLCAHHPSKERPSPAAPFDFTAAFLPVIDRMLEEAPVESWDDTLLVSTHERRPELFCTMPHHIGVEVTNEDNLPNRLRAPRRLTRRPTGRMDEADWTALLESLRPDLIPLSIDFWDFGEPLLHPRLPDWIRQAHERHIRVDLYTNGTLLDPERATLLVEGGVDAVFLRLDAARRETHQRVTGDPTAWERARRGVEALLEAKRRANRGRPARLWRPVVVMQITDLPEVQDDFDAFFSEWDRAGELRANLQKEGIEDEEKVLASLYPDWPIEHVMIRRDHRFCGRVDRGEAADMTPLRRIPCRQLQEGPYVLWNGDVVPCRADIDGTVVLGHVRNGLAEVWRGNGATALRGVHRERKWEGHPLCGPCRDWFYGFS